MTASLERSQQAQQREAAAHDRAVAGYTAATAQAAASDLSRKRYHNPRDPEHRWGMGRLAALLRKIHHSPRRA